MQSTYSPDDNKLRLYSSTRLDAETYAKVKAAGFRWAPKQGFFFAPAWSPQREDLLLELCGEIGDEDTSLVERAEERAERFEQYSENRTEDANRAHEAVQQICDGIPMGQPILVGHHSEKHARRDAAKIDNGMRRAVKMWDTAKYWERRAAGALAHAKYKELPQVRARRIKTIEAEIRQYVAGYTPHADQPPIMQERWSSDPRYQEGVAIPHVCVGPHGRGGHWVPQEDLPKIEARAQRWLAHLRNRLAYERAMLAEGGGLKADAFDIQVGGRVSNGREWYVVLRLNKKDGQLLSVSVAGRYCSTLNVEDIRDYRAPEEGDAEKVKTITKLAPLCNFRSDGCQEMTTAEWKKRTRWSDSYFVHTFKATETTAAYRHRTGGQRDNSSVYTRVSIFLTDAPVKNPPALKLIPEPAPEPLTLPPPIIRERQPEPEAKSSDADAFEAMREQLRSGGVQVVTAPQLFPTPPQTAEYMVDVADVRPGQSILEPSAGTGRILDALQDAVQQRPDVDILGVERNLTLVDCLRARPYDNERFLGADFLECNGNLGLFDRIIMNPPFENGSDIKHIQHALTFLQPGGRLVALCANGPRQQEKLKPLADYWEDLPDDTFKAQGTGVRVALLVINKAVQP